MKRKERKQLTHLIKKIFHWYKKKGHTLSQEERCSLEEDLQLVDQARIGATQDPYQEARSRLTSFAQVKMKKSLFASLKEIIFALLFALVVATCIRQMWFELYEIPTGSMRPTFQEKDRLIVSKTNFGINVPLTPKHLYFDPKLVQRGSIVTFTVEDMPAVSDPNQIYFYLFPGKKRLIKRLIAKPGDTIYFYGGKIYGIDAEGQEISSFLHTPYYPKLTHIPFMSFSGKTLVSSPNSFGFYQKSTFKQMNEVLARAEFLAFGKMKGELLVNGEWKEDKGVSSRKEISTFGDFWGMKNFAMARILSKKQVRELYHINAEKEFGKADYFLELKHSPTLASSAIKISWNQEHKEAPSVGSYTSFLPLPTASLQKIFASIYTSRFIVKNGQVQRYSIYSRPLPSNQYLYLPAVPDGTYEFFEGKAFKVAYGGMLEELSKEHPLSQFSPEFTQELFNLGIDFLKVFQPSSPNQPFVPQRYAYFREGNLCVLNSSIFSKRDPLLVRFVEREKSLKTRSTPTFPYQPFIDHGPPVKDGKIDKEFIKTFGLNIPEKSYLALGDNYASSGDCREFGFIPQENLRGGPDFILWPPGKRWGAPAQEPYPLFTAPRLIVWGLVAAIVFWLWRRYKRGLNQAIFKKLDFS